MMEIVARHDALRYGTSGSSASTTEQTQSNPVGGARRADADARRSVLGAAGDERGVGDSGLLGGSSDRRLKTDIKRSTPTRRACRSIATVTRAIRRRIPKSWADGGGRRQDCAACGSPDGGQGSACGAHAYPGCFGSERNPSLVAWGGASDRDAGPLWHARSPVADGHAAEPWRARHAGGRGRQPRVMGAWVVDTSYPPSNAAATMPGAAYPPPNVQPVVNEPSIRARSMLSCIRSD